MITFFNPGVEILATANWHREEVERAHAIKKQSEKKLK